MAKSVASRHGGIGGEGAVGRNVLEDLLDHGDDVRIVDCIDLAATVASATDDPGQSELSQVLARRGHAYSGSCRQRAHVVFALGGQSDQV